MESNNQIMIKIPIERKQLTSAISTFQMCMTVIATAHLRNRIIKVYRFIEREKKE